jgi:hypothetical protein
MMKNITHPVADFDSIVEDERSHAILLATNLLPSSWKVPHTEEIRILGFGVKLKVVPKVRGTGTACYVGSEKLIEVSEDFLTSNDYRRDEKIATLLHESGHAAFAFQTESTKRNEGKGAMDSYLGGMERYFGDHSAATTLEEEVFADDFTRLCGYSKPLHSVLLKLDQIAAERIAQIEEGEPLNPAFNA